MSILIAFYMNFLLYNINMSACTWQQGADIAVLRTLICCLINVNNNLAPSLSPNILIHYCCSN